MIPLTLSTECSCLRCTGWTQSLVLFSKFQQAKGNCRLRFMEGRTPLSCFSSLNPRRSALKIFTLNCLWVGQGSQAPSAVFKEERAVLKPKSEPNSDIKGKQRQAVNPIACCIVDVELVHLVVLVTYLTGQKEIWLVHFLKDTRFVT